VSGKVIPIKRALGQEELLSDEALVAACATGDRAALGALFDRHHLRVHRFLCRIAGLNRSDAEDLVQDTFTAAWSSAARFRADSKALTWLFGIAANVARNHNRSKGRGFRALQVLGEQPIPSKEAIDEIAARREAIAKLEKALGTLAHDHRVALVMCDLEGASGNDAAKALGVRPGTIWRWLHEARKTLRARLEEEV
jgi:RNA polymerase sigma-70 factor, ECF subfamily